MTLITSSAGQVACWLTWCWPQHVDATHSRTASKRLATAIRLGIYPDGTSDAAAHRQADSRLHLAIASLTESPKIIDAVTGVQADLHDMLIAIPVLPVNIEHSDTQHDGDRRARSWPVTGGGPAGRWRATATTPPRCCEGCSGEDD